MVCDRPIPGLLGRTSGIGFAASGGYESWGQFYDGRENLIASDPRGQGGLAGADEISLYGKVDVPVAPSQRLTASVNYYSLRQDLKYGRQPGTYGETPTSAATSVGTLPPEAPGTDNVVAQLRYEHEALLGTQVTAQAYAQDFESYFGYSTFYPGGGQSLIESTTFGVRLDATTPLGLTAGSRLFWGLDALRGGARYEAFSGAKGVRDADDDGSYETPLPGNRIPPEKITGYVETNVLKMRIPRRAARSAPKGATRGSATRRRW